MGHCNGLLNLNPMMIYCCNIQKTISSREGLPAYIILNIFHMFVDTTLKIIYFILIILVIYLFYGK